MKEWGRTRVERRCGLCGQLIGVGQPVQSLWLVGHSWRKIRCVTCADEAVPLHLPELKPIPAPAPMTPVGAMARIGASAVLPFDWKARQAERDAGEDG